MARIRTIKPEFPHSESMGKVSRDARLLFVLLWTIADDSGRARGCSRMLASLLFPYDDDAPKLIDGWIGELEKESCVVRYEAEGSTYIEIRNWSKHQKIDKPSQSRIPPFDESSRILANPRERSSEDLDQGSKDLGSKESTKEGSAEGRARTRASSSPAARPDDVKEEVWNEWLEFRRKSKGSVSLLVIEDTRKKAKTAGMTMDEALTHWVASAYKGFFPPKPSGLNGQASKSHPSFETIDYRKGLDKDGRF